MKTFFRHFTFNFYCALCLIGLKYAFDDPFPATFSFFLCFSYLINPDLDNATKLLNHRSAVTHSALIPTVLFYLSVPIVIPQYLYVVRLAFYFPFLTHLIGDFDFNPTGYGQISTFGKRIGKKYSLAFMALNVAGIIVFLATPIVPLLP